MKNRKVVFVYLLFTNLIFEFTTTEVYAFSAIP